MTDEEAIALVETHYPDLYEEMHEQDTYHADEYAIWFMRGRESNFPTAGT